MLIYHQWGLVTFIWAQFYKRYLGNQSLKSAQKVHSIITGWNEFYLLQHCVLLANQGSLSDHGEVNDDASGMYREMDMEGAITCRSHCIKALPASQALLREIHRPSVNYPYKGWVMRSFYFSLLVVCTGCWKNGEVTAMYTPERPGLSRFHNISTTSTESIALYYVFYHVHLKGNGERSQTTAILIVRHLNAKVKNSATTTSMIISEILEARLKWPIFLNEIPNWFLCNLIDIWGFNWQQFSIV